MIGSFERLWAMMLPTFGVQGEYNKHGENFQGKPQSRVSGDMSRGPNSLTGGLSSYGDCM